MTARPVRSRMRGDIQGLRAIAVLLVIGIHSIGVPRAGFVGVDVFFVVSGFVITTRLIEEADSTGSISLPRFYLRRLQRIAPAAFAVLAAVAAASAVLPQPRRASVQLDVLWAAVGAGDFRVMLVPGQRGGGFELVSPVVHFWSLAVEEQFYLLWPAVLLAAVALGGRRGGWIGRRRAALIAASVAVVGSFAAAVVSSGIDAGTAYYSPFARAWELGVGSALALVAPALHRLTTATRTGLAFAGLAAVDVATVLWMQDAYPVPGGLLPVLGTAALIAAGTGGAPFVSRLLAARPLRWIGDRSYSLYLWHLPVLVFVFVLQPDGGWIVLGEGLALTVVLSMASYAFLERPFLGLLRGRTSEPAHRRSASALPEH